MALAGFSGALDNIRWEHPKANLRARGGQFRRTQPPALVSGATTLFAGDKMLPQPRAQLAGFAKRLGLDDIWCCLTARKGDAPPDLTIYMVGQAKKLVSLFKYSGHFWRRAGAILAGQERLAWLPDAYPEGAIGGWANIRPTKEPELLTWGDYEDYLRPGFLATVGMNKAPWRRVDMLPLPRPGAPFTRDGAVSFYSVKEDGWFASTATEGPYWRPCDVVSAETYGSPDGPVLWKSRGLDVYPMCLTSVATWESAEHHFQQCRDGIQWPSIAVSWRQHEWKGDVAFYFDARLLSRALGLAGKRQSTVHVYEGDGWTTTTKELLHLQEEATAELRGKGPANELGDWLAVLGPKTLRGDQGQTRELESMKEIRTVTGLEQRMKALQKIHGTGATRTSPDSVEMRVKKPYDRYPYAEMKITDRVGLDQIPLIVVAPTSPAKLREYETSLAAAGFRGTVLHVDRRFYRGDIGGTFDDAGVCKAVDALVADWAYKSGPVGGPKQRVLNLEEP